MKLHIKNGRLFDPSRGLDKNSSLYIDGALIVGIGEAPSGFTVDQEIDATGRLVCPGFIDLAYSLREPGFKQYGSADIELKAAAKAGFTAVCSLPDSSPINDSTAVTNLILDIAERAGGAKVLPLGAMTQGLQGEKLSNMYGLREVGCVAMSNGDVPVASMSVLRRCFQYAATHGIVVFARPEEVSFIVKGGVHEGAVCARLGLPPLPEVSETLAVSQLLLLAEEAGAQLHLSQLSTARSVELVSQAKARGVNVTADVAIQQLIFTESAIDCFDGLYHTRPPLRAEFDRQALIAGVQSGVIDVVCSRHQPMDAEAKQAPFAETQPGLATIELVLPMMLKLVRDGQVSLERALQSLTGAPAKVLGLDRGLAEGLLADVVIVDEAIEWQVDCHTLISQSANNPWLNQHVQGRAVATCVAGELMG